MTEVAARPQRPGRVRLLTRGLLRRCPNCGSGDVFTGFFAMRERCPHCGHRYDREEGYWLGAMAINIAVTEALFGAFFVLGMVLTWPDVPWTGLLIGGLLLNATFPVVFYPVSKTLWVGLDLAFHPPEPPEEAEAITARERPPGI
ncbi:MAG: DUF983 domain-containing protein [Actinobacteria bacterium]|nr:DUF983 domain-containing protein [Actinomycetota bacterium]